MAKHKPGKKGSRKYGRNKVKCERYRREGRREKNKARRAEKRERWLEKRRAKRSI
jgi:hypothetical protein